MSIGDMSLNQLRFNKSEDKLNTQRKKLKKIILNCSKTIEDRPFIAQNRSYNDLKSQKRVRDFKSGLARNKKISKL